MDGYYDYHPTLSLARPLALTGFFGSGAAGVGQAFCQLTGVPLIELDRWLEHQLGASLSAAVLESGTGPMREHERTLLTRALDDKPCGVVVLGDATLLDPRSLKQIKRHAWLVYVRVPFDEAFKTLTEGKVPPGELYPWLGHRPEHVKDVWPLYEERLGGYEAAHHIIDRGEQSALALARQLKADAPRA